LAGNRFDKVEQQLASWPEPPTYAAMFGSAGRGEMRIDSDIDVLLIREDAGDEALWRAHVDDLVFQILQWTGNDMRPLEYTVAELVAAQGEPVLADIARTGVTVAGQRSWFDRQLRARKA
jgi:hypothetical protein